MLEVNKLNMDNLKEKTYSSNHFFPLFHQNTKMENEKREYSVTIFLLFSEKTSQILKKKKFFEKNLPHLDFDLSLASIY
jgi:hypothetical protein